MTGPAVAGASWAKTGGKPSAERKDCTRENTDGGAGSTESSDRMMLDWSIEAFNLSEELLTKVLASSHATSSDAVMATATPRVESITPTNPRWTRRNAMFPTMRPTVPHRAATPSRLASATTVRDDSPWTNRTVTDASRAPR